MMWFVAIIGFALSMILTYAVRLLALRFQVVDKPDADRKLHGRPVPLLGGVALFFSFWAVTLYIAFFNPIFGIEIIKGKLIAAFAASVIIMLIGIADDLWNLSPVIRLGFVALAALVAVVMGFGIERITNPAGGIFEIGLVFGKAAVFVWLLGIMFTTKITDGLDGLATGIVAIGSLMIYFLSTSKQFYQPNVATVALIFAGVCAGFLVFNFHPAKIFLGESGSLFVGFILGILAVISGGKVATALLVMAVPALDIGRVIYRRILHHEPIFKGDRRHLHYQLIDRGFSVRQVVLFYYFLAAAFGVMALVFESLEKIAALFLIIIVMAVVAFRIPEVKK